MTHDPAFDVGAHGGWVCGRCGEPTGNTVQGHYWSWCRVTQTYRQYHLCCPGNCELEATRPLRKVLTVRAEHLVSECPNLQDCAAHTEWYESWLGRNGGVGQA